MRDLSVCREIVKQQTNKQLHQRIVDEGWNTDLVLSLLKVIHDRHISPMADDQYYQDLDQILGVKTKAR